MAEEFKRLSFAEKAGYSLGDGAANFVFMSMVLFQLNFYTDTMGLSAAAAGTLLLVGRFWDAFFDPMMGMMADRTNTRWGKFRPWVLWTTLPWGIFMVLAYYTPGFSMTGKFIWACATNIILMTLYSANNTPYSAMAGVMTGDVNDRTRLSQARFVSAMLAQLIVGGFTLPLVAKLGHGDNAKGWTLTMSLWAVLCMVMFVVTFFSTRERIQPDPHQKFNPKEDFANLAKNGPWICMFVVTLMHFIYVAMRGGTVLYFFQYYMSQDKLFDFLQAWGLTSGGSGLWYSLLNTLGLIVDPQHSNVGSVGVSLFNMYSQAITVVGVLCSAALSIKFGKKAVAIWGFALTIPAMCAMMLLKPESVAGAFWLEALRVITYAPTIPLLWAMFADVADFAEWKTGRRTTGLVFATIMFALKTGLSLGGAITGWLLSGFGYVANQAQTPGALLGIRLSVSIFPGICLLVVLVCLFFYQIDRKLNLQIQDELAARRAKFAAENS